MRTLEAINAEIKKTEERLEALETEKENLLRETIIMCRGCRKGNRIKDITYIQTHWYTPPYGCSGGDYWNSGEGNWVCPECSILNRLVTFQEPRAEEYVKLKPLFKEVTNTYKD